MEEIINIAGLTDVDREILQEEFEAKGIPASIDFEEPVLSESGASALDPLSATVIVSSVALLVVATWICREKRKVTKFHRKNTDEEVLITTTESSNCKVEVLAQLSKYFPSLLKDLLSE